MTEVEKLLGRKLSYTEMVIYEMFKNSIEYHFEKDSKGNLIAIKNE